MYLDRDQIQVLRGMSHRNRIPLTAAVSCLQVRTRNNAIRAEKLTNMVSSGILPSMLKALTVRAYSQQTASGGRKGRVAQQQARPRSNLQPDQALQRQLESQRSTRQKRRKLGATVPSQSTQY